MSDRCRLRESEDERVFSRSRRVDEVLMEDSGGGDEKSDDTANQTRDLI